MKNISIQIELWSIHRLVPGKTNPRTHTPEQVAQIAGSIREFGFVNPVLVAPDGGIIAGEGRYRAALTLGLSEVPVIVLAHLSAMQRQALAIADNQIALNAAWDEEILRQQLTALNGDNFDLALLGFDDEELAGYLADDTAGLSDEDSIPALPINPVTRSGDLWLLGSSKARSHWLQCGDATNSQNVERLLEIHPKPVLMVTDPPYGVNVEPEWRERAGLNSRTRQGGKLENDTRIDWSEAWLLFPGAVVYVWHAGIHAVAVALGLQNRGFVIRSQIIWAKQHFAISRGAYHWQHEPCWYAVRKGEDAHWHGDRAQTTLWEVANLNPFGGEAAGENEATGHATQKPVEIMRRPILNHTRKGDSVYDPFLGSGTTLIAAESSGRICCGMEIDPRHVDVAVQRWQEFTGKQAVLDGDGKTFEQVARGRRRKLA